MNPSTHPAGHSKYRHALAALALFAAVGASASSLAAGPGPATTITITRFAFDPKELTVAPGTKVRWINRDETPHTVASLGPTRIFASKALDTDDQFEFTFTDEGDFAYLCTVHPFMTGVVHVRKK